MTVSVIGTVGIPACYGGFESLVENLVDSKSKDYLVYCQASAYDKKIKNYKSSKLKYVRLKANGVQSILYDIWSILHSMVSNKNDLLILGVSGAIVLPIVKLFSGRKVVTNIDGLEWRRAKWGRFAKWFLKCSEAIAVKFSDIIVSDNEAITNYIRNEYNKKAVTIAYGGDHSVKGPISKDKSDYYLALCRIEPENNVDMILEAVSKTNQKLKFVGNWNNSPYGLALKERYMRAHNIELLDPIYEVDTLFNLRSKCKGYIHGHSAGGTNPSLVEMMHFGVPTFCFNCSYNKETTENEAIYFGTSEELATAINQFDDNGYLMENIARRRYTWSVVRNQYENLFY